MADVRELYRDFHRIPEFGDRLPRTKARLLAELDRIGVEYVTFDGHDSVVVDVVGALPGKTAAYRADMDALHVTEATGLEYASEIEGSMHACGHDAHTAVAISALERLYENRAALHGRVRFLFEAGEELGIGARHLLDEHALDGVDAVFGLHVGTLAGREVPSGTFVVLPGAVSAAKDKFTVKIVGNGGHGAYPSEACDPIRVAAQVILAAQSVVSMEVPSGNAAVITFGSIHGGVDDNSIPGSVELSGTVRTQDRRVCELIRRRLVEIVETLPRAFGASGVCTIKEGSQTVMNDASLAKFAADTLAETLGAESVLTKLPKALMGSDDFSRLAARVPGVYFFLSTSDAEKQTAFPNHNPKFRIDESALERAVDGVYAILRKYSELN